MVEPDSPSFSNNLHRDILADWNYCQLRVPTISTSLLNCGVLKLGKEFQPLMCLYTALLEVFSSFRIKYWKFSALFRMNKSVRRHT